MALNLWGEIPLDVNLLSPKAIFETQANELSAQTKGLLEGVVSVEKSSHKDYVRARLFIKVPALNNYMYEVCSFAYPLVEFYPCMIYEAGFEEAQANNEEELLVVLGGILQSERVKRAVLGLLSQAKTH